MKNSGVIICLILLNLPVVAQNTGNRVSFGLCFNPQIATGLPQKIEGDKRNWILAGATGLVISIELKKNHNIETGLLISRKGFDYGGKMELHDTLKEAFIDYQGSYPIRSTINFYYYFFDIPLCYQGNIINSERYSIYIKAGLMVNILQNLTIQTVEKNSNDIVKKESVLFRTKDIWLGDPRKINLSGSFGSGICFAIGQQHRVSIGPNINFMLFPVDKGGEVHFINIGLNINFWLF